ncbi:ComEA family DNA-binding protein [Paenibacillus pini]|uniref:ComEA family DNA-binding protein n=1 Tax=Paenibacillus pini TaxID=669461 RepID=UPI001F57825E|nr:helix-hairpin-helix domain-containing protein [Paenibacillus pini]
MSIGISVCCALIGSAAIVISGVKPTSEAIAEWEPLNQQVDQVLNHKEQAVNKVTITDSNKAKTVFEEEKAPLVTEVKSEEAQQDKKLDTAVETVKPVTAPTKSEAGTAVAEDEANVQKVNVNTAQVSQLMNIPGIGEKKAQAIIDYRTQHGPFRQVSDLDKVKGIGPKLLDKMKPYVQL